MDKHDPIYLLPPCSMLEMRTKRRYDGTAPEPRPNLPSGHIPNSISTPFLEYLEPASADKPYTSFKSPEELKKVLSGFLGTEGFDQLVNGDRGAIFTCGSGMTAAVGWLAHEIVRESHGSKGKTSIYDEVCLFLPSSVSRSLLIVFLFSPLVGESRLIR